MMQKANQLRFNVGDSVRILYATKLSPFTIEEDGDTVTEAFRQQANWDDLYGRKGKIVEVNDICGSGWSLLVELPMDTFIHLDCALVQHLSPLELLAECAEE